jgi:hypothetical protein
MFFHLCALCLHFTYEWTTAQEHPISNPVSAKNKNKIAAGSK